VNLSCIKILCFNRFSSTARGSTGLPNTIADKSMGLSGLLQMFKYLLRKRWGSRMRLWGSTVKWTCLTEKSSSYCCPTNIIPYREQESDLNKKTQTNNKLVKAGCRKDLFSRRIFMNMIIDTPPSGSLLHHLYPTNSSSCVFAATVTGIGLSYPSAPNACCIFGN
jgi:hypothetical protein